MRHTHFIAVVVSFLIGCVVLLLVGGCAGVRSEASNEEQGRTEATASEEDRCEGTRTFLEKWSGWLMTTNDIPGCPHGGLLSGTDKADALDGKDGDDEIHGLGARDIIEGGDGNDVIYGGPGDDAWLSGDDGDDVIYGGAGNDAEIAGGRGHDFFLTAWPQMFGGPGEDVIYGGDGNDFMSAGEDKQPDKLYCGEGMDRYEADKNDYVDSSCEKKITYP